MYWYDTRDVNNKKSFPSEGWIFPCVSCSIPVSTSIIIKYKYKYIEVYICKTCNINTLFNPKKIKLII